MTLWFSVVNFLDQTTEYTEDLGQRFWLLSRMSILFPAFFRLSLYC